VVRCAPRGALSRGVQAGLAEDDAYELLRKGLEMLEEDEPGQAVEVLERARRIEPSKGSILEALGRAYYSSCRYEVAASMFEEALEVDPTNDYAHYCLGLCFLKLTRKVEAAGHFKIAWSLKPSDMYRDKAHRFGAEEAMPEAL
jgi:tetratricopeptide (TPR) repeat protein